MRKEHVFEILMQGDCVEINALAERFRNEIDHEVIKPPSKELVMFRVEESVEKIDFNVGEVLVTSAEVRIGQTIGYSMVMDIDEQKALDCAFLMGIYQEKLPQAVDIEALIERLEQKLLSHQQEERELVESTRVRFEVMGGQDPNVKHQMDRDS